MFTFTGTAVPGKEPMSVYMFSQTLLIRLLLRETRAPRKTFLLTSLPGEPTTISSTSSNSEMTTWPAGVVHQSIPPVAFTTVLDVGEGHQRFPLPFYGLCLASQRAVLSVAAGSLNSAEVGAKFSPERAPSVPGRQNFTRISRGTLLNNKKNGWVLLCFKEFVFFFEYCLPPACCWRWKLMTKFLNHLGSWSKVICVMHPRRGRVV